MMTMANGWQRRRRAGTFRNASNVTAPIERLETRCMLSGTVNGSWPGPHNIKLTLDNGSLSTSSAQDLTINAAQYATGGGKAIFSGAIIGPPFSDFHVTDAELQFLNNQSQVTTSETTFTPTEPSPAPNRNQIRFSDAEVALAANQVTSVTVSALRPLFQTAVPFPNLRILVDTIAPTIQSIDPVESPRNSSVSTIFVTMSEPVQLSAFTFQDLSLTRDGNNVPLNSTITVSAVSGGSGRYEIDGLDGFTDGAGVYQFTVNAAGLLDIAGNPGTGSSSTSFTFDPNLQTLPTPPAPILQPQSDTGSSSTDGLTTATSLSFNMTGIDVANTSRLFRDGQLVGTRIGPGTIVDSNVPPGPHTYTAGQVSPNGITSKPSTPVTVVVDVTAPTGSVGLDPTQATFSGDTNPTNATTVPNPYLVVKTGDLPSTPANVVFVSLTSIDGAPPSAITAAPPVLPGQTVVLTIPSNLSTGIHTATVRIVDAAGNATSASLSFTILANPALATPGTPVYSTIYDLTKLQQVLDSSGLSSDEKPWSMSFDRTTQTVWAVIRGNDINATNTDGNRLVQLDPATGEVRTWSLQDLDTNSGPHGIFFDFETHLTPRVWFTQRTGPHPGLLSYLDLATNQIVTYDILQMLKLQGYTDVGSDGNPTPVVGDLHAVFVDRRGVVWVSDEADKLLLELDFRGGEAGLASTQGQLIVHKLPSDNVVNVGLVTGENVDGPHGIEVVIDDRDDSPLVYFTTVIQGRFNMLKPAGPGGVDQWYSWNLDDLIRQELGLGPNDPVVGAAIFPTVDTNETPGNPLDDKIYFGDPGFPQTINKHITSNDVIRQLQPGNLLEDPNATTSPITTWRLPPIAGTPAAGGGLPANSLAQINQTFVDRDGTVYFIDRRGGVGRVDVQNSPGEIVNSSLASSPTSTFEAKIEKPTTIASKAIPIAPFRIVSDDDPRVKKTDSIVPPLADPTSTLISPQDRSNLTGVDQYLIQGPLGGGGAQGSGAFRGAFSAGNVLFGSLTQGDLIGSTIFAEEARRETAVVTGQGNSRMVFQVRRDGSVIVSQRDAGSIVDRQYNITRRDASGAAIDPAINGDVAAVNDASGTVYVFGRDNSGGLAEYLYNPATATWTSKILGHASSLIAGDPQAFLDPVRGAAAIATTANGHLVEFFADNGQVVDLTNLANGDPAKLVYSKPGVVESNGMIYVYGTDQLGKLIEYTVAPGSVSASARCAFVPDGNRDLMLFQDLEAVVINGVRHVFGTDGNSRLIHVTIQPDGTATAENVTELTKAAAVGYSAYQQPFAGRVYGGANAVVAPDGEIYVYGTNGRDLIEFHRNLQGQWNTTDLTNAPANRVFGNPSAYMLPNGDRHILLINETGELIEYYKLNGLDFATINITLAQGNSTETDPGSFPNVLSTPGVDDFANRPGASAALISLDAASQASIAGQINFAGDQDVFRFVASRTGRVTVRLSASGSKLHTILNALNGRAMRIAHDGARRLGTDTHVTFSVVAGRTYYLAASAKGKQVGMYSLSAIYASKKPVSTHTAASPWHGRALIKKHRSRG